MMVHEWTTLCTRKIQTHISLSHRTLGVHVSHDQNFKLNSLIDLSFIEMHLEGVKT